MSLKMKIASGCYLANIVAFLLVGAAFVFGQQFFPFHADVIQTPWNELSEAYQTLYLGMMRTEGAGYLAAATAMTILFFIPFRRGEAWASWAIATIGLVEHLPTFIANYSVAMNTAASPPWPAVLLGMALLIAGLILARQKS